MPSEAASGTGAARFGGSPSDVVEDVERHRRGSNGDDQAVTAGK